MQSLDVQTYRLMEMWINWIKMMYKKSDVDPSNDEISVDGKSRIQNYVTRN